MLSMTVILLYHFQPLPLDIRSGDGEHAGKLDHHALCLADADYAAFDTGEGTGFHPDFLAGAEQGRHIGHIDDVVIYRGRDPYEILHCLVRHHDRKRCRLVPDVVERQGLRELHPEAVYRLAGGKGKQQVAHGRDQDCLATSVLLHFPVSHGDERGDPELVELVFQLQFAPVGDAERVPLVLLRHVFLNMPACRLQVSDMQS